MIAHPYLPQLVLPQCLHHILLFQGEGDQNLEEPGRQQLATYIRTYQNLFHNSLLINSNVMSFTVDDPTLFQFLQNFSQPTTRVAQQPSFIIISPHPMLLVSNVAIGLHHFDFIKITFLHFLDANYSDLTDTTTDHFKPLIKD